ncbi:MAG: branched-chain amino acid ABC transporter substrate-binding protein [Pseudomonadota bacterium]
MTNISSRTLLLSAALLLPATSIAQVRIAFIEGLSGPFARSGETLLAHVRAEAELINQGGGVLGQKLEIVPFDGKSSPQESMVQFKAATDQGIRYVTQGASSGVAHALVDAINKWNTRNPDKTVLFLNYAAMDPTLTNEKCSFWHFRFDANSDMKLEAITNLMTPDKSIKKVYVIGQDYAHGHQVAKAAREMLAKKRKDVKIVGEDLHPIGKVKDFSPYISKIIASGADTVITGNWGNDLALLIKAAKEAGLKAKFYTMYAGSTGGPSSIAFAPEGQVTQISDWHRNVPAKPALDGWIDDFNKRNKPNEFIYMRIKNMMGMTAKAMSTAKSTEPKAVALALEDMRFPGETGEIWMRKSDHQVHMPLFLSYFVKKDGKAVKYDAEETGLGWKTIATVSMRDSQLPTSCIMERQQ